LKKLSLCYSIVYYRNGARWYKQLLQVNRLYRALMLLGLDLSSKRLCVFGPHGAIYIYTKKNFFLHPFSELSMVDWPLTWLTNHCPSTSGVTLLVRSYDP